MTDVNFPQDFYLDDVGVWRLKKEKLEELEKPKPMTNEEFLKSCNTEQLAEFMRNYTHDIIFDWKALNNPFLSPFPLKNVIGNKCTTIDGWVEWLK